MICSLPLDENTDCRSKIVVATQEKVIPRPSPILLPAMSSCTAPKFETAIRTAGSSLTLSNQAELVSFSRRVISGASQLTLSNAIVRLFSIVSMPILTRLLSPQAYGVTALAGTVISLLSVFALSGIDVGYARAYNSAQPPSGANVEHYCWRFAILGALLASAFGAGMWWCFNKDIANQDSRLAILVAVGIALSAAQAMAQTRARLAVKYRALAVTIISSGIISTVASIGIAVTWRQDALALLIPMLVSYLVPVLWLGVPPIAELMKPSGLTRNQSASLIKIGLAAVVTAPMYWLLSSSDRWFLQYYHGAEAVGIYSIGYSVAVVGMTINSAVISVWFPEASREFEQDPERAKVTLGRLMSRIVAAMALIWLMGSAAGGDIIRCLADARFHTSAQFVPFIAGGVFFYGTSQLALYELVLVNQFKWAALWWFVGGLVCAVLNLTLVPRYAGGGAALAQSVSFAFICIAIFTTSQAKYSIQLTWSRLAIVMLADLVAGVFLASPWHRTAPVSLLMKVPVIMAVASITAWVIAPDWCAGGIKYLRRPKLA